MYKYNFRFWFFKVLIVLGIGVGAFFIPQGDFEKGKLISTYKQWCKYL